jgi:hypothetical protein
MQPARLDPESRPGPRRRPGRISLERRLEGRQPGPSVVVHEPRGAGRRVTVDLLRDWRLGSVEQRYATIRDIRGQLTPQRSRSAASDLSDEAAYRVFQHACAADFSDKLRLYKLYAQAQGFAPLTKGAGGADLTP